MRDISWPTILTATLSPSTRSPHPLSAARSAGSRACYSRAWAAATRIWCAPPAVRSAPLCRTMSPPRLSSGAWTRWTGGTAMRTRFTTTSFPAHRTAQLYCCTTSTRPACRARCGRSTPCRRRAMNLSRLRSFCAAAASRRQTVKCITARRTTVPTSLPIPRLLFPLHPGRTACR